MGCPVAFLFASIYVGETKLAYQIIARKWRPQIFEELIGQNHISQTLLNAIKNKRLPQALLFTGPRGTGKTSMARILAKAIRCPQPINDSPCGKCDSCKEIVISRSLDVIEIDGASNNGVEAIRELRESVSYRPSSGFYKIYIIDEVHMLSISAFNALLKTLEEPPEHVIFILATTEVHKIPATILSRCQKFDFRRIPTRLIQQQLRHICESDGITSDDESLWLIARQGDGSLRDSLSLLDQVITFCDSKLNHTQVMTLLGLTNRTLLLQTLNSFVTRDVHQSIKVIDHLFSSGCDPQLFIQDLLEQLRNLLLVKMSHDHSLIDLADSEIESLKELSAHLTEEDIHFLFDMALKGASDIVRSSSQRTVLEMVLLRLTLAPRILDLSELRSQNKKKTTLIDNAEPQPSRNLITPEKKIKKFDPSISLEDNWVSFVNELKINSPLLGAKLENTHILRLDEHKILLGVPAAFRFLHEKVKEETFLKEIGNRLHQAWGKSYQISFEVCKNEQKTPRAIQENIEIKKNNDLKKQIETHPLIQSAQAIFDTEIKSIK